MELAIRALEEGRIGRFKETRGITYQAMHQFSI